MFWSVALYELKYRMTRISTHLYAGIFFALALLLGLSAAGVFENVDVVAGVNVYANSPYTIAGLVLTLGLFGVVVTANFMGHALVKDFEHKVHPLLFTTPLREPIYLAGRYVGALLAALYVMAAVLPGLALAYALPMVDADLIGPTRLAAYLQPYLLFVVPNTLVTGALFFGLAALTRQMLPNYVGGVLLLMGYLIASVLTADAENLNLAAYIDPFGLYAQEGITRYWTTPERNALLLPLEGVLLTNRLIWLAVGVAAFGLTLARFRFSQDVASRRRRSEDLPEIEARPTIDTLALPTPDRQFGLGAQIGQALSLARREVGAIVRNVYFYVLILAALGFLAIAVSVSGSIFGTPTLPVTAQVVGLVTGSFTLFIIIIVVFYSGELVWRERDLKANQLYDTLPVPSWLPFVAKLLALWAVIAVLLLVMMMSGMAYQLARGFTDLQPGLYLTEFFGVQFVDFALLAVLAMTVHVIVNHKYVGHLVLVLYLVGLPILLGQLGFEHNLYDYGSDPGVVFSDMNRYGHFVGPFIWFKLYWAAFAVLLAVGSNLLWMRGQEGGVRQRLKLAGLRFTRPVLVQTAIALVAFLVLGGFIFYNTNVLNEYRTEDDRRALTAEYERLYKQYETLPQPRITAVETEVDLFPTEQAATIRGTYTLANKTGQSIPSVHLDIPSAMHVRRLAFAGGATEALRDTVHGYWIYDLARPLVPGDSTTLAFDLALTTEGFRNSGSNTQIVYNGTFINNGVFPHIGYQRSGELSDAADREDEGLPPRERVAAIDDSLALRNTDLASDADFVRFAATVSTTPDQIAIAPGRLQREWTEGGRRYFRYEMGAPILNFYAFLSARYAVEEDTWTRPDGRTVDIQIFHHPDHDYNVERMIEGVKATLAYGEENFSPYQYDQVRIIEFPRYATFAQSFPNTIPFSESIGFIADVGGEDDIDYPYYVTAHEVAHQWWGHQVAGGAVQGSTFLIETLAQYTALMVMKARYGEAQMGRFLGYELDQYLLQRTVERRREQPLELVEGQQYIHYNKGSLAMYALQDYLGEDRVNTALSRFLDRYAFQGPPYPTSRDLIREFRAVTPDSLDYLLTDLFETITLYANRAVSATAEPMGGDRYRVTLDLDLQKVRADSTGAERTVRMNDWLPIAVFDEDDEPLVVEKRRLQDGRQSVEIVVQGRPARAGVDPYNEFPDRVRKDNTTRVTIEGG